MAIQRDIVRKNLNAPGPQTLTTDSFIGLNSAFSEFTYVDTSVDILSDTAGSEAASITTSIGGVEFFKLDSSLDEFTVTQNVNFESLLTASVGQTIHTTQFTGEDDAVTPNVVPYIDFVIKTPSVTETVVSGEFGLRASRFGTMVEYLNVDGDADTISFGNGGKVSVGLSNTTFDENSLILKWDSVAGNSPTLSWENLANAAGTTVIGNIFANARTDAGGVKTNSPYQVNVADPADATYSTQFIFNVFDNGPNAQYLVGNGSTRTMKCINRVTKVLEDIITDSDLSLQNSYDGGQTIELDGVNNFLIQNSSTADFFRVSDIAVDVLDGAFRLVWDAAAGAGPTMTWDNPTTSPSTSTVVGRINAVFKDTGGAGHGIDFIDLTIADAAPASYSSKAIVRVYDNQVSTDYIEIDGSASTIKVPNSSTGTLDEVATVGDLPVSAYGEMYFEDNATETVISVIDTPVQVNATYVSGLLNNFTHVTGTLTYTGATTSIFYINVHTTSIIPTATSTNQFTMYMYVNGSPITVKQSNSPLSVTLPASLSLGTIVSLDQNDTIEIFIENNVDTENYIVENLACSVFKLG